jgi:alkylhydroperoxidase family enzyme
MSATPENYPGELEMFRGLVRVLRVAARNEDMPEVQRLLWEHASDEAAAYEQAGETPDRTAADLERQAALMAGIRKEPARRWKSGRAVGLLRRLGYHPISPRTASRDLAALAAAGLLVMHEETGVRFYTVARRGGTQ